MGDDINIGGVPTLPEGATMADFWENREGNEFTVNLEEQNTSEVVSPPLKRKRPPTTRPVKQQVRTQPLKAKLKETDNTYSNMWEHFEKFCYKKLYGEDEFGKITSEGEKMVDMLKFELESLYKEYMDRYTSNERNSSVTGSSSHNFNVVEGDQTSSWDIFDSEFQMELDVEESLESKCELTRYLNESCEKVGKLDILQWWKTNSTRYPILSKVAKDVLAIPVSTVSSEQAFSTGGRILNEFRSSLKPNTVEMLVCTQNWLKVKDESIDLKTIIEDVEKYEEMSNG